jgi:hypothetical protein
LSSASDYSLGDIVSAQWTGSLRKKNTQYSSRHSSLLNIVHGSALANGTIKQSSSSNLGGGGLLQQSTNRSAQELAQKPNRPDLLAKQQEKTAQATLKRFASNEQVLNDGESSTGTSIDRSPVRNHRKQSSLDKFQQPRPLSTISTSNFVSDSTLSSSTNAKDNNQQPQQLLSKLHSSQRQNIDHSHRASIIPNFFRSLIKTALKQSSGGLSYSPSPSQSPTGYDSQLSIASRSAQSIDYAHSNTSSPLNSSMQPLPPPPPSNETMSSIDSLPTYSRMVRCRICENEVRSDGMEQHSQGCAQIHSYRVRQDECGTMIKNYLRELIGNNNNNNNNNGGGGGGSSHQNKSVIIAIHDILKT